MESLIIKESDKNHFIPNVHLDANTGQCEIAGESYLEDSASFYEKIKKWLLTYIEDVKKPIHFRFKLAYFNTSSSKGILDVLSILRNYEEQGGSVSVDWYYAENDTDSLDDANDYMDDTGIKMNLIAY
jgi:hypothetical protein